MVSIEIIEYLYGDSIWNILSIDRPKILNSSGSSSPTQQQPTMLHLPIARPKITNEFATLGSDLMILTLIIVRDSTSLRSPKKPKGAKHENMLSGTAKTSQKRKSRTKTKNIGVFHAPRRQTAIWGAECCLRWRPKWTPNRRMPLGTAKQIWHFPTAQCDLVPTTSILVTTVPSWLID